MPTCLQNKAPYGHYPHGFNNGTAFSGFILMLINRPEMPEDATFAFQGSSVTGVSYEGGQPFDVGRVSDFDIAIASTDLWKRSIAAGVEVRWGQGRTGPLQPDELRTIGIARVSEEAHNLVVVCSDKPERTCALHGLRERG